MFILKGIDQLTNAITKAKRFVRVSNLTISADTEFREAKADFTPRFAAKTNAA